MQYVELKCGLEKDMMIDIDYDLLIKRLDPNILCKGKGEGEHFCLLKKSIRIGICLTNVCNAGNCVTSLNDTDPQPKFTAALNFSSHEISLLL